MFRFSPFCSFILFPARAKSVPGRAGKGASLSPLTVNFPAVPNQGLGGPGIPCRSFHSGAAFREFLFRGELGRNWKGGSFGRGPPSIRGWGRRGKGVIPQGRALGSGPERLAQFRPPGFPVPLGLARLTAPVPKAGLVPLFPKVWPGGLGPGFQGFGGDCLGFSRIRAGIVFLLARGILFTKGPNRVGGGQGRAKGGFFGPFFRWKKLVGTLPFPLVPSLGGGQGPGRD